MCQASPLARATAPPPVEPAVGATLAVLAEAPDASAALVTPFAPVVPEVAWRGGLDLNPLDVTDRRDAAQDEFGLGYCNITKFCSEVCPEGIHLTDNGIIPLKERVVDRRFDPITFLGATIRRRKKD